MSTAVPTIPPRPSRSGPATLTPDIPQIPPRPHRRSDRSQSPNRAEYTRSPLNELPTSPNLPPVYHHRNISASDLPERPPSVQHLPSIGHEGDEYASLERTPSEGQEQHRNVAADLPMHQPTASLSKETAKSRIQTVTRIDSSGAAPSSPAKAPSEDDKESEKFSLRAKASFNRSTPSLALNSRPESLHEQEHVGIPEIGVQVPMYPLAGDVQAPSPAPSAPPHATGVGFFNDGSQRNHHRRRSSRQDFNPPGSYGMHGHGMVEPRDQFERAWYQKHPEELAKEMKHPYDPGHPRSEWALSSEQLNKLVHGSTNRGLAPSDAPDEQTGYRASEQYASRKSSPKPSPLLHAHKRPSNGSQTHVESPLRKASFPFNENADNHAIETDDEDHQTVRNTSKGPSRVKTGSGSSFDANSDVPEDRYGLPILASDELAKYPTNEYQHAAVEWAEKHGDEYHSGYDSDHHQHEKRRSSRPSSAHGEPLSRFISHEKHEGSGVGTPLHEIQEYEPLFPDDDEKAPKPKPSNKHLRPDLARHHFPSQDIWEDNPDSLGLTATVSTPDLPLEPNEDDEQRTGPASTFESPEKEADRKNGPLPSDRAHYLPKETERLAHRNFKPGVLQDIPGRPGLQPRFPSRDIWEDTPDSMRLETTVSTPDVEEQQELAETPNKPVIPSRPAARTKAVSPEDSSPTDKKAPVIPDRPKPTIPARPAAKGAAAAAVADVSTAKAKPTVPSRPAGKLASIKASFMNDLNSRLQLGPQVVKKEEPKEEPAEPAPLADARKGRARGPARRKPAATTESTDTPSVGSSVTFSISGTHLVFSINDDGHLEVATQSSPESASAPEPTEAEERAGVSAVAVGAHGDLPDPSISEGTLNAQKAIEPILREAIGSEDKPTDAEALEQTTSGTQLVGAAEHTTPKSSSMVEEQTQTGQHDITITSPKGDQEKVTTYLGGHAPDEGNVVVKSDGTEEVGKITQETPRKIAQTGHGM
ncbi:hypothetical protein K461DRAFT_266834 [Myriangium duriaei CBS 260.36]|uniref:Altered inheritance of mitochondria protein 21 n=1 Tax=Myriangium duriaei CBS 260.36 TaxID=1168546 RepID=A0A9P4J594_9PEZI|nr:hypothetical protein K461DRAFT_266834 [Myriangium duriaei CBS 260.36]